MIRHRAPERGARKPSWRRAVGLGALTAFTATIVGTIPAQALPSDTLDPIGLGSGLGSVSSNIALGLDSAFGMISPNGIGSLLDSSFSLASLDPVSGAVMGTDVTSAMTGAYAMTTDLSSSSILALDTADLSRRSLEQAEAARQEKLASTANGDAQQEVGPDGCPASAPANTLRAGSASLGVAELCANSVAQAPTPEAAVAIKYQLNHLGQPYSQPNRMKDNWYDCSSLAMRSYSSAGLGVLVGGWAPNTAAIRASKWAERISLEQTLPGDLVYPSPGHVATKLSDGYIVHTNRPGDVSHVTAMYKSIFYAVRVHPELV